MTQHTYCPENINPTEVVAFVDRYRLYEHHHRNGHTVSPQREAQTFKLLFGVLGKEKRLVAIIHENDKEAEQAYQREGYEIHTMNGNRPQALPRLLEQQQCNAGIKQLVVVSDDPVFGNLCTSAMQQDTHVAVWSPSGQHPVRLADPRFAMRTLDELLPSDYIQPGAVFVWLDIENLLIGLKQQGIVPSMKNFVNALKTEIADLGQIMGIVAYGDFGLLRDTLGYDVQRELEKCGVRTRYQVNLHGKNSADMEIASDIHTHLEQDDMLQTVIIGTGDRDFRPAIEAARAKGKHVVLLALKDNLSRELQQVADEVRYLDKHFAGASVPDKSQQHTTQLSLKLQLVAFFGQQQWINRNSLPMGSAEADFLTNAIQEGLLLEQDDGNDIKISLNTVHPLVLAVQYAARWIPQRVAYLIREKGMPYVDTNFLTKGMQMDHGCRELNIGQDRVTAEAWLHAAAIAGLLHKSQQPHPKTPDKVLDIWLPAEIA